MELNWRQCCCLAGLRSDGNYQHKFEQQVILKARHIYETSFETINNSVISGMVVIARAAGGELEVPHFSRRLQTLKKTITETKIVLIQQKW
jgi:hypothetical protein